MSSKDMNGRENIGKPVFRDSSLVVAVPVTPVHAGAGRGAVDSIVDLPVQRDFMGIPCIWSSSFKGAMRSLLRNAESNGLRGVCTDTLFGPEDISRGAFAGCIAFTDLKLLFVPGPCKTGVCLYTSLTMIELFLSMLGVINSLASNPATKDMEAKISDFIKYLSNNQLYDELKYSALIGNSELIYDDKLILPNNIILDGRNFRIADQNSFGIAEVAETLYDGILPENVARYLSSNIIVVPRILERRILGYSLLEFATRIRLDEKTKTVKEGALWTEENVPELSLFYGALFFSRPRTTSEEKEYEGKTTCKEMFRECLERLGIVEKSSGNKEIVFPMIIGGHETIGRGVVRIRIYM